MYQTMSFAEIVEHDLEEFEGDLRRYRAANRRSAWFGLLALALGVILACTVCSAIVLIVR